MAPERFYAFSAALFAAQRTFFDVGVVRETRNETYARLAQVANEVGVDEEEVMKLLRVPDQAPADGGGNVGNRVTDDVKLMVKVS